MAQGDEVMIQVLPVINLPGIGLKGHHGPADLACHAKESKGKVNA